MGFAARTAATRASAALFRRSGETASTNCRRPAHTRGSDGPAPTRPPGRGSAPAAVQSRSYSLGGRGDGTFGACKPDGGANAFGDEQRVIAERKVHGLELPGKRYRDALLAAQTTLEVVGARIALRIDTIEVVSPHT